MNDKKRSKELLIKWAQDHVDGIALNGTTLWGTSHLKIHSGGLSHLVSANSFYQVNLLNNPMVDRAIQLLKPLKPERILDLYSGYGNPLFSFCSTGYSNRAYRIQPKLLKDAKQPEVFGLSAKTTLQDASTFKVGQSVFDVALLDPPRSGAGRTLQEVALTRPKAILYISCNPSIFY